MNQNSALSQTLDNLDGSGNLRCEARYQAKLGATLVVDRFHQ
jgi:hypothetical protein